MREENPALLAHNVNSWFRQEPAPRMLRTLDGTARAFLSNRYRRIDHMEILQAALPILGEIPDVRFESCQITDDRMYVKAVNPRLQTEVSPGDIVLVLTNCAALGFESVWTPCGGKRALSSPVTHVQNRREAQRSGFAPEEEERRSGRTFASQRGRELSAVRDDE
jgi:hypothetical protein